MYPTRLNLLSPEKKKNLERVIVFQFLKNILEIFLVVVSISAVYILASQHLLEKFFHELTNNGPTVYTQYTSIDRKIKRVNAILRDVADIQQEYIIWSPEVIRVVAAIPVGVRLTSLDMRPTEKTFSLTGYAQTRNDLLDLQSQLEKIDCVGTCRISVPISLSQLIKKNDISFSLIATITQL